MLHYQCTEDKAWGVGKLADVQHGSAEVRGRLTMDHVRKYIDDFASSGIAPGTFLSGGLSSSVGGGDALDSLAATAVPSTEASYAMWCGPPSFNDFAQGAARALGYGQHNSFEF